MPSSECSIIRAAFASILGALGGLACVWKHGILVSALVGPLAGSATAAAAAALFWSADRLGAGR